MRRVVPRGSLAGVESSGNTIKDNFVRSEGRGEGDPAIADRAYVRPPRLSYGRQGGGIRSVTYTTDDGGNVTGVTSGIANDGGTVDLFVGD